MHAHAAGSGASGVVQPPKPHVPLREFQERSQNHTPADRTTSQAAETLARLLSATPETPIRDLVRSVSLADVFCALSSALFDHSIAQVVHLANQGDEDARVVVRLLQRLTR